MVAAMGGLNPHFTPPPGFPALRRLTIAFGRGDNPRITLQGYLAMTSNTRQIGARAEVYAAAAGFNIYGWVSFDALLTILPLAFTADLSAGVALRRGTRTIAGVHLSATLTGPLPMRAKGEACLSLFFFDICVPFDVTVGETVAEALSTIDPWPLSRPRSATRATGAARCCRGSPRWPASGRRRGRAPGALVEPMAAYASGRLSCRSTGRSIASGSGPPGPDRVRGRDGHRRRQQHLDVDSRAGSLRAGPFRSCPTPRSSRAPPSS